jgi:hypothetical protein
VSEYYKNLSPLWTAIGSVFLVPLLATIMVFAAVALMIAWPTIPILVYLKSKAKEDKL